MIGNVVLASAVAILNDDFRRNPDTRRDFSFPGEALFDLEF